MMSPHARGTGHEHAGPAGHLWQRWHWLLDGAGPVRMSAELPRVLNKASLAVGGDRRTLAEWLEQAEPQTLLYRYVRQQAISLLLWEILQCTGKGFPQKLPLLMSMLVPRRLEPVIALRARLIEPEDGSLVELPLPVGIGELVLQLIAELGLGDVEPFMVRKLVQELAELAGLAPERVMAALLQECAPMDQAFLQSVPQLAR